MNWKCLKKQLKRVNIAMSKYFKAGNSWKQVLMCNNLLHFSQRIPQIFLNTVHLQTSHLISKWSELSM